MTVTVTPSGSSSKKVYKFELKNLPEEVESCTYEGKDDNKLQVILRKKDTESWEAYEDSLVPTQF